MAISGNVALTNTFDQWRIKTNETITAFNSLELANVRFVSNTTNTIQISGGSTLDVRLGNTVYISSNALPVTGGTITGNVIIGYTVIYSNGTINMLGV